MACHSSIAFCRRNAEKQLGRAAQDTGPHNVSATPSRVIDLPVKVILYAKPSTPSHQRQL